MFNFKGFSDWIEIFRGGKQVDSEGVEHDGDELIAKAVAKFDPNFHEPPVVVGHPKDNSPAFGWVEALKTGIKDGAQVLYAKMRDVAPEFRQAVEKGLYKKRSASFYPDGMLRHVGFLGAAPPAVKGLADLRFVDEPAVTFEFAASSDAKKAQIARAKKYGIAIKDGGHVTKPSEWSSVPDSEWLDPVNYRYPCLDAWQTRAAAAYWGVAKNQAQYTTAERSAMQAHLDKLRKRFGIGAVNHKEKRTMNGFKEKIKSVLKFMGLDTEQIPDSAFPDGSKGGASQIPGSAFSDGPQGSAPGNFSEAEFEKIKEQARKEEREKLQADFAEKEQKRLKAEQDKEISNWVEAGVKAGKIIPAWAPGLIKFMQGLDAHAEIEFTEGKKQNPLEYFEGFLADLGKSPIFKEIATKGQEGAEFAEAKKEQELGESIAAKVTPVAK